MVRFCHTKIVQSTSNAPNVSIPPWFDFAARARTRHHCAAQFQSHLGSILPRAVVKSAATEQEFQSHLGSILPLHVSNLERNFAVFQSHLGSILPCRAARRQATRGGFQSHLGSILPRSQCLQCGLTPCFNPTLVRFCPPPTTPNLLLSQLVSIPPWFDFALYPNGAGLCGTGFQSHLGSILPLFL